MLDELPQLEGGCIGYWEASNWALNDLAEPRGPKSPREHRRVHMHLFGRSPRASPGLGVERGPEVPVIRSAGRSGRPDFATRCEGARGS